MRRQQVLAAVLVGKSILLREGLAKILRSANFRILDSVSCADDLHPNRPNLHPPLFLIVHTGDDFDAALEQIELFRNRHPDGRIAVVADHYRLNELVSAFRAGANGYFVNVITCDRFIKSVELVMMGETIFPPAFLSFILDPNGPHPVEPAANDQNAEPILVATEDPITPQLSPREKLILRCIIEGDPNKCIARKIDIAEATVKVHVKAILRKIRVQNRTQAAIWGINNGSRTQPENGSHPPLISDMSKRFVDPIKAIGEVKQIEAPAPTHPANCNAYHVEAARIERLVRKGRRTPGTTRLGK
jgi:two-component system nitrate/nitrite response regulator NarL